MYNKAILIGRMVADPEMRTTVSGSNVASFRVAVNRPKVKDREQQADFITVTAWGRLGEFACTYFGKGKPIGIEGPIHTGHYTDRDGIKRPTFEVKADRLFFVGSKDKPQNGQTDEYEEVSENGDLPF